MSSRTRTPPERLLWDNHLENILTKLPLWNRSHCASNNTERTALRRLSGMSMMQCYLEQSPGRPCLQRYDSGADAGCGGDNLRSSPLSFHGESAHSRSIAIYHSSEETKQKSPAPARARTSRCPPRAQRSRRPFPAGAETTRVCWDRQSDDFARSNQSAKHGLLTPRNGTRSANPFMTHESEGL